MNKDEKIQAICRFVSNFPESTASLAIKRRCFLKKTDYETSLELSIDLESILKMRKNEEIDFCYYLIK